MIVGLAAALLTACGGDDDGPGADAGGELNTLEVLDPPGESIGLAFHDAITLRAQYRDPSGEPISGVAVAFQLVTSPTEATGGSAVSATEGVTDADGIAHVDLVAGAERVNFRVQATAAAAAPALFYIAVSEGGFTDLTIEPRHHGFRGGGEFGRVELRLYRASELRCGDLDIDEPPESVFPPRALDGFGDTARYKNVTAGDAFTVIAWGAAEKDGRPLAAGCVELGADQVRAGRPLGFPLPVHDRAPAVPPVLPLASELDAEPLHDAVTAAGDRWAVLDCPLGRAQLLIDCALDAQASDGTLDCVVNGTSAVVTDVQAERGAPGGDGCRPAMAGAEASIDAVLDAAIGAPWPSGAALDDLLDARRAPLTRFTLASRLEGDAAGAVRHRLGSLGVSANGEEFALDLVASDRPVVRQVVPAAVDTDDGVLVLGTHAFTVDYGRFAREAIIAIGLTPAGLADRASDLGTALFQSVDNGSTTGCAAFSEIVCADAGRAVTCLSAPCATADGALDDELDRGWTLLDGADLDLSLAGDAELADADADLLIESLGAGQDGRWNAEVTLDGGETVSLDGDWVGGSAIE